MACFCCDGRSNVFLAKALGGDADAVDRALQEDPTLLMHMGWSGLSDAAWHLAASKGHLNVLEVLVRHLDDNLPLISKEVRKSCGDSFNPEHTKKYVINLVNSKGQTPLMFACFAGHAGCVELLIKLGADPWVHDLCGGRTALHYSALHGHSACICTILDLTPASQMMRLSNARSGTVTRLVNTKNVMGCTALHYAAWSKKPGTVRSLLDRGANLLAQTASDSTYDICTCPRWTAPLHIAAYNGFEEGVREMLLHYMAVRESGLLQDPRLAADRASRLPHHVATLHGHSSLATLLHPTYNLDSVYSPEEVYERGVPKLAVLAALALRKLLLLAVDAADSKIAQLPPLDRIIVAGNSLRKAMSNGSNGGLPSPPGSGVHSLQLAPASATYDLALTPVVEGAPMGTLPEDQRYQPATPTAPEAITPVVGSTPATGATASPEPAGTTEFDATPSRTMVPRMLASISRTLTSKDSEGASRGFKHPGTTLTAPRVPAGGGLEEPSEGRAEGEEQPVWWGGASTGSRRPMGSMARPGASLLRGGAENGLRGEESPRGNQSSRMGTLARATPEVEAEIQTDWWAAADLSAAGRPPTVIGAPIPGDRTTEPLRRGPSLLDRMKSIGRLSKRHSRGAASPSTHSVMQEGYVSTRVRGSAPRTKTEGPNPFAAAVWGTTAMVEALPSMDTCTVCLDEVYALVLTPCLHRVCAPCARLMVMTIKDKPLGCPVCRASVSAAFAPHDVEALENALHLR